MYLNDLEIYLKQITKLTLIHKQFVKLQTLSNYQTLNNVIYILVGEISIESSITFSITLFHDKPKKKKT
jgi:hypothetical protein